MFPNLERCSLTPLVLLLHTVFGLHAVEQDRHVSKQSQDAAYRREVKPQEQVQW